LLIAKFLIPKTETTAPQEQTKDTKIKPTTKPYMTPAAMLSTETKGVGIELESNKNPKKMQP